MRGVFPDIYRLLFSSEIGKEANTPMSNVSFGSRSIKKILKLVFLPLWAVFENMTLFTSSLTNTFAHTVVSFFNGQLYGLSVAEITRTGPSCTKAASLLEAFLPFPIAIKPRRCTDATCSASHIASARLS